MTSCTTWLRCLASVTFVVWCSCYASVNGGDSGEDGAAEVVDEAASGDDAAGRDADDGGFPGMELIPGGAFLMGSGSSRCTEDEPVHEVWLRDYYIDQFEISNDEYAVCVADSVCSNPIFAHSRTRSVYYGTAAYANYPVVSVRWEDAAAYCAWAAKRLPTEAEWEKAARGGCELGGDATLCEVASDAWQHPWGDTMPSCALANIAESCLGDTAAVDEFPGDISPYGVRNMEGNVREWVSDYYDPTYYARSPRENPTGPSWEEARGYCIYTTDGVCHAVRGFSFVTRSDFVPYADITCRGASSPTDYLGFRCARDSP